MTDQGRDVQQVVGNTDLGHLREVRYLRGDWGVICSEKIFKSKEYRRKSRNSSAEP